MAGIAERRPDLPFGGRFLPRFLYETSHSRPLYVLKAWLLALVPSMILAGLVTALAADAPRPNFGGTGMVPALLVVLFAPVVETFLMVPPLLLFNRYLGPTPAVLLSSALWGALHSSQVPLWGLIIWWPFLLFSVILLVWRERSLATAMLLVIGVHALQNSLGAAALLLA